MDSRKFILQKTLIIALGLVICIGAMIGIYALLGCFDTSVLIGGIIGGVLGVLNFFFMAVSADMAADKAAAQDVKGGKALIRSSFIFRLIVMLIVLIAFAKSGLANPLAMVIPIFLVRPIISLTEFFRKSGEHKS